MRSLLSFMALLPLLLPLNAGAYMKNYLPLDQREISLRFPQRVLRSTFVQGMSARFASATIRLVEPDNEIRFSGVDESGKPWTLTAHAMQRGAIYSADL